MEKWLMDFDDFMGEKVMLSSFSGATMVGYLTDYTDDYLELEIDGEYVQVPIEPVRNIRIVEE